MMASFFSELKRRNVFKVGVAYGIVAWLLIQIASTVLPTFEAPGWIMQVFTFFMILGFPVALIFAWAFELTPEGIKATVQVDREERFTHVTGQKLNYGIIGLMAVAIVFLLMDNYLLDDADEEPAIALEKGTSPTPLVLPVPDQEAAQQVLSNSVAVLPFENLSPDPDDAYFAAGIHEEILNQLAKIGDMSVISRTSVLSYAGSGMKIPEIARELNVQMVMEGSVRFAGGQVRIAAQLIDAATDEHIWSEVYQRNLADIFAVQADIATSIARALRAELTPEELASIEKPLTDSPKAYALYLKAMSVIGDIGPINPLEQSAEFHQLLDQATELDPEFALAHAFRAYDYAFSMARPWAVDAPLGISDLMQLARHHADTALALDPDSALAHAAYGLLHYLSKDVAHSEMEFERSLELDPKGYDALSEYGFQKSLAGQHREAIEMAAQALAVDSHNWSLHALLAYRYKDAGEHREALRNFEEAVRVAPGFFMPRVWLGLSLLHSGLIERGMREFRLAEGMMEQYIAPAWTAQMGHSYGLHGDAEGAQRMLQRILILEQKYRVGDLSMALAYLGVGRERKALEYMQKAAANPYVDESFTLYTEVVLNVYDDPVMEKPEFRKVRELLNFANK